MIVKMNGNPIDAIGNHAHDMITDAAQQVIIHFVNQIGYALLQIAPQVTTMLCLMAILGGMLGSERCRHWASITAIATLVFKVVSRYA